MTPEEKKLIKARKLVDAVNRLAKKQGLNFFIVTDGASGISNNGNPAVRNAREAQIKWELEHGADPYEDWSKNASYSLKKDPTYEDVAKVFDRLSFEDRANIAPRHPDFLRDVPKDMLFDRQVVVDENGNPVGFNEFYYGKDRKDRRQPPHNSLGVVQEARGNGLAKLMVEQAIRKAKKEKIKRLVWEAFADNESSIRAALASGFEDRTPKNAKEYRRFVYRISDDKSEKNASAKKETYTSGSGKVVSFTKNKTDGHDEIVIRLKNGKILVISNNTALGKPVDPATGSYLGFHGYLIDGTNVIHKVHPNKHQRGGWLESKSAEFIKKADPPNSGLNDRNPVKRDLYRTYGFIPQKPDSYLGAANSTELFDKADSRASDNIRSLSEKEKKLWPAYWNDYLRSSGQIFGGFYTDHGDYVLAGSYPYNSQDAINHELGHRESIKNHGGGYSGDFGTVPEETAAWDFAGYPEGHPVREALLDTYRFVEDNYRPDNLSPDGKAIYDSTVSEYPNLPLLDSSSDDIAGIVKGRLFSRADKATADNYRRLDTKFSEDTPVVHDLDSAIGAIETGRVPARSLIYDYTHTLPSYMEDNE